MLNAASLSVRPLPGDFLPEDDESAAKPLRVEIGKATEDSGKIIFIFTFISLHSNTHALASF